MFRLNVKLCQQKLDRTTFDKALATSCLDCQFSGSQKAPDEEPRVLPVPGKMATEAGAQASQAGRHPPPHSAPAPAHSSRGEGRRGGRGGGCLPGNLERWAGRGACWELPPRALLHNLAPAALPAPPGLLRGGSATAPLSTHPGFLGLRAGTKGISELA